MMKRTKRLLSLALAMIMAVSLMVPASAVGAETQAEMEHVWTYEEMANLYCQLFPHRDPLTAEEIAHSAQLIQEYDQNQNTTQPYLFSDVDKVDIATYFSLNDGLSSSTISNIVSIGTVAQLDANNNTQYDNDSYRHFTWNYRSTKTYGAEPTRIYTINFEWAGKFLGIYDELYETALGTGGHTVAKNLALAGVIQERDKDIGLLQEWNSLDAFITYMDGDSIQDFYNNYYGRLFATSSSYSNWEDAYVAVQGSLCKHDQPNESMSSSVYSNVSRWVP